MNTDQSTLSRASRNLHGRDRMTPSNSLTVGIAWATWHDLRHTFVSRLAMNGQNEGTMAALLRLSTTPVVKGYSRLSPPHLKAAVEGVAGFGKVPAAVRENQSPAREN